MKKSLSLILVLLLVFSGILFLPDFNTIPMQVEGTTITVNDDGGGADYTTIQDAIDNAITGDTIEVWEGEYVENVIINKSVTINGNGSAMTIINGNGVGDVVKITANWVNISRFNIINSNKNYYNKFEYAGIKLENVSNVKITNNNCSDNYIGICLLNSTNNDITANVAKFNYFSGIYLYESDDNDIIDNIADLNTGVSSPPSGLVGYWKMDEAQWDGTADEVIDYSGLNNHGTSYNNAKTIFPGRFSRAGKFDGGNDFVRCSVDSSLKPQKLTVSAWVNAGSLASTKVRFIVDGDYGGSNRGYALLQGKENSFRFVVRKGSGSARGVSVSDTVLSVGEYYHVVGTFINESVKIYVNGKLENDTFFNQSITYGPDPIEIGHYYANPNNGYDFNGIIDDVMIFNRDLTEVEIKDLYFDGHGIYSALSNNTIITGNNCSNNRKDGIRVYSSFNNTIRNNNCSYNKQGISTYGTTTTLARSTIAGTGYVTNAGTKIAGSVRIEWLTAFDFRRGWVKINLSKIPDDAIVTRVILRGLITVDSYVINAGVRLLTNDPTTAAGATVYSEAGSGTRICGIYWQVGELEEDVTYYFRTPSGRNFMRQAIKNGWLGLGFDFEKPTTSSNHNGVMRGSGYQEPMLEIEYVEYLNSTFNMNKVTNNNCSNNNIGISTISSDGNTLSDNLCENNGVGINSYHSSENTINDNICLNNNYGQYFHSSTNNQIIKNKCTYNTVGINFYYSSMSVIEDNKLINNSYGIRLERSNNTMVTENHCLNNSEAGIELYSACNNTITNNDCADNNKGISLNRLQEKTIILGSDNPEYPGQAMGYSRLSSGNYYCDSNYYTYSTKTTTTDTRGYAVFDVEDLTKWSDVKVRSAKLVARNYYLVRINVLNFTVLKTTPSHQPSLAVRQAVFTESGPSGIQIADYTITPINDQTVKEIEIDLNSNFINELNNKLSSNPSNWSFSIGMYISKLHLGETNGLQRWYDMRLAVTFDYSQELKPTKVGKGIAFGDELTGYIYKYTAAQNYDYGFAYVTDDGTGHRYRSYYEWDLDKMREAFPQDKLPQIRITNVSLRFNHFMTSLTNIYVYHMKYSVFNVDSEDIFTDCGDGKLYYGPATVTGTNRVEYEWDLNDDAMNRFQLAFDDTSPGSYFGLGLMTTTTGGSYSRDFCPKLVIEWDYNYSRQIPDGIKFTDVCSYNIIYNNNCSNNYIGMSIANSSFNVIKNNELISNSNDGVYFYSSSNNEFVNNNVSNSTGIGIHLQNSYDNDIYYNNIISNNQQVFDNKQNTWNNTDNEGNYWSDYIGVDDGSGSGKHAIAGDGIGDTLIPHQGLDDYPFIFESGWLPPDPPELLDPGTFNNDSSYLVTWEPVVRGEIYALEEDGNINFNSPTEIYNGSGISSSVINSVNGIYYYRVRAINLTYNKISAWSNVQYIIVDLLPDIPQNFQVSVYPEGNGLNLTWDLNLVDTETYELENKTFDTPWTSLAIVQTPIYTFNHTDLEDGKRYYYRIRAHDARDQLSDFSGIIDAVPQDSIAPATPTGLMIEDIDIGYVNLTWDANTEDDLEGYVIHRNTSGRRAILNITSNNWYNDTEVVEGEEYFYAISAFDEVPNYSPQSSPAGPVYITIIPRIIQTLPSAGALDVSVKTTIGATFSRSMNVASVESAFSVSPTTAGTFEWFDSNTTFSFTPTEYLVHSTKYTITIGADAKDQMDNNLLSTFEWDFTTEIDTLAPTIKAYNPTGTEVIITTDITVNFSEAMDKPSVETGFNLTPTTPGNFSWSNRTLKFSPISFLLYKTTYEVKIDIGAKDLVGNSLSNVFIWNFTTVTEEELPPEVVAYSPIGVSVPIDADVTIEFVKQMNHPPTENAFSISPYIAGGVFSWNNNILIFTHTTDFNYKTTYNVSISTAAVDLWGNHLASTFSWEFTTEVESLEPPKIIALFPEPDDVVEINTDIWVEFSRAIQYQQIRLVVLETIGEEINGTTAYNEGDYTLSFVLSEGNYLSYDSTYSITLSGIEINISEFEIEIDGNTYTWNFKTKSESQADSDSDGMIDKWENDYGLNPFDNADAYNDLDEDSLTNVEEFYNNTNPELSDSDNDGLSDGDEVKKHGTNPILEDTDGDGHSDKDEISAGTDPINENDYPDKKEAKDDLTYIAMLLIVIIIIIILLILLLLRRRRGEEEEEEEEEAAEVTEEEEEEEEVKEMECPECGAVVPVDETECLECGAEIEEEELDEADDEWRFADEDDKVEIEEEELSAEDEDEWMFADDEKIPVPEQEEAADEALLEDIEAGEVVKKPKKGKLEKPPKKPGKVKGKVPISKKETKVKKDKGPDKVKKMVSEKTTGEKPKIHTMDKLVKCNMCFGNVKTGLNIITCSCGKHYHENCGKRVGVCPVCETSLKELEQLISESEE